MDTTTLAARRERALGAGAPLFYDKPLHIVRGEGVHLFDADGPPLRRHVQQRAVRRACQSARRRGDVAPAGHAQRPQPLPARRHRRPGGTPGRAAWPGDRKRRLQLLGDRGQRGGAAHGAHRDRQDRDRLHQRHLSRQQRSGRKDDAPGRRPEQRRRRARHPLPRDAAAAGAGRERSRRSRRPISSACAARSAASRTTASASRR